MNLTLFWSILSKITNSRSKTHTAKNTKYPSIAQIISRFFEKKYFWGNNFNLGQNHATGQTGIQWKLVDSGSNFSGRRCFSDAKNGARSNGCRCYLFSATDQGENRSSKKTFQIFQNNSLIYKTFIMIIQNEKHRLPSSIHSLRPDCSTINLAKTSEQPEDWLFHPIGITYKFVAKKL